MCLCVGMQNVSVFSMDEYIYRGASVGGLTGYLVGV